MRMMQQKGFRTLIGQAVDEAAFIYDLPDLVLWLDAADPTTITDAGAGAVSQWNDKSGNGYHVTEATNRPTTGTRTINGLNTLDFDGTNDRLSKTTGMFGDVLRGIYAVVEPDTVAAGTRYIVCWGGAGSNRTTHFWIEANDPRLFHSHTILGTADAEATNQASVGVPILMAGRTWHGYAAGTAGTSGSPMSMMRANGVNSTVVISGEAPATTAFYIGSHATASFFDGKIGEIIAFGTAPTGRHDLAIRNYLAKKWAVTV